MSRSRWQIAGLGLAAVAMVAAACASGSGDDSNADPTDSSSAPTPTSISERVIPGTTDWPTDWSNRSIDLDELLVGLPGRSDSRDGIRPIDNPVFETVEGASDWLVDREPVILLELDGTARAYPLQILISHEIVNDEFNGVPVAITYCPLCNSAVGFDRRVDGQTLRFGVSGLLRFSDLVMWDDATTSLWQQITGEAIVGEHTGNQLDLIPTPVVSFGDFAAQYPDGEVLSQETGFGFAYGRNPYAFYDSSPAPVLFDGELDDRYPPMERVVAVRVGEENKAYPFSVIGDARVVNDEVADVPIVVFWGADDTASALSAPSISEGDAVGTGIAFERTVSGQVLTFSAAGVDVFEDQETGTKWNLLGSAIEGPLAGEELVPLVQTNEFWFAWAAFNDGSSVFAG
ncbi:MAG: DUF3179 domain-containing protein [Dehalococcoidia bacterium]